MPNETLENRINEKSPRPKSGIWNFMVSAYSSSKAVKLGLLAAAAGYSLPYVAALSCIFYFGAKTIGNFVNYAANLASSPMRYLSATGIKESLTEAAESYNPFGKYRRPTFMGATLSAVTHYTEF